MATGSGMGVNSMSSNAAEPEIVLRRAEAVRLSVGI
jgi:hypothetical protein